MKKRVRAIIIQDKKLLSIKRQKESETYWVFPGGGVEDGETEQQALERECKEELGVEIDICKFVAKDDYQWNGEPEEILFYECAVLGGKMGSGTGPEYDGKLYYEGTHEIEWLDLKNLKNIDLRPHLVRDKIISRGLTQS